MLCPSKLQSATAYGQCRPRIAHGAFVTSFWMDPIGVLWRIGQAIGGDKR
jgi:hypothetical protein